MSKTNQIWLPNEMINDLLKRCEDAERRQVTRFKGMSYEQGILYGIRWLLGKGDFDPFEGGGSEKPVPVGPFGDE